MLYIRNARAREDAELGNVIRNEVIVQSQEQGKQPAFVYRLKEVW